MVTAGKKHWFPELLKILVMGALVTVPLVLICLYTKYYPMNYGDDEMPYYLWNRSITESSDPERVFHTVILGDSSANAAYLPEALSEDTINLSLGGTTPAENYYVLANWLKNHEVPETVYLSFMDYHMVYDNMFYDRTVYSHLLTKEQEKEILHAAEEYGEENIAIADAEKELFFYEWYLPNKYLPALLNGGFNERKEANQKSYDSIRMHRGAYIGLTVDCYSDTDPNEYSSYPVNPFFDYYYRRILDLCQDKGITVRIVSLPKTGNSVLSGSFRNQRDGYYEGLCEAYDNVTYFNAIDTMPVKYFHDWEHFNLYGGWAFSDLLKQYFPEDFRTDEWSEATKAAVLDYMNRAEDAAGLCAFADGHAFTAVAISNQKLALFEEGSGFEDTGLVVEAKNVWLKQPADVSITVQEANTDPNGFCIWTEPDESNSIVSGSDVYSIVIDPFADLTVLILDTSTHQPLLVRNYMYRGDELHGH